MAAVSPHGKADSSHDATLCHRLASHSPMATGSGPVARSMSHRNHPGALPLCSGRVFYLGSSSVPSHPHLFGTFTPGRPDPVWAGGRCSRHLVLAHFTTGYGAG